MSTSSIGVAAGGSRIRIWVLSLPRHLVDDLDAPNNL
jgi:hypothetical protein